MKKNLLLISIFTFFVAIGKTNAIEIYAEDGTLITDENRSNYMCKNPYGDIIFPNSIELRDTKIDLFCEYKDEESAMEKYISENQEILLYIQNEYSIEQLNHSNWEIYKEYATLILNEYNIEEYLLEQAERSRVFFGLYEDKYINEKIIGIVGSLNSRATYTSNNIFLNELNEITPYYSEKIATSNDIIPYVSPDLNVSDATYYAKKWAWGHNYNEYANLDSGGDCTNFVSQILEAGGIRQNNTGNQSTGWWHTKILGKHIHSRSWTLASAFVNHWGPRLATKNIKDWAESLYEGDIVAADWEGNGSWDHLGYVTERGTPNTASASGNGVSLLFRDIKIAQHSNDYERWISEEGNGWEDDYGTRIYGKIRG